MSELILDNIPLSWRLCFFNYERTCVQSLARVLPILNTNESNAYIDKYFHNHDNKQTNSARAC